MVRFREGFQYTVLLTVNRGAKVKVGDLVVARYDVERLIHCVGVVTNIDNSQRYNIKVVWLTKSEARCTTVGSYGWWIEEKLMKFE